MTDADIVRAALIRATLAGLSLVEKTDALAALGELEDELALCRAALTDLRRQMEELREQGDWPVSKVVAERDAAVEKLHRCREDFHAKVSALQSAARPARPTAPPGMRKETP